MKTILLVLIFPSIYFAQENKIETSNPAKPSTTACPKWNKKNKNDKAAFFQYLRSPKTKENQQATFNKPQNSQQKEVVQKTENTTHYRNINSSEKKSNQSATPTGNESRTFESSSQSQKIEIISVPKVEEKKVEANTYEAAPTIDLNEKTKDKNKTEDSKLKRKLKFMSRKTTKVHRHSNAKCPSF